MATRDDELSTPRFPIRVAARRAGVSVAALRAWERRYGAVRPARSEGEQRLYSETDIERIALLRQLTVAGHAISAIADASTPELRRLCNLTMDVADTTGIAEAHGSHHASPGAQERQRVLRACLRALYAHDGESVHRLLQREAIRSTPLEFIDELAAPFMRRVGDEWATQRITEGQERLASGAVRRVLGGLLQTLRIDERDREPSAPAPLRVLVTTLNGERHENGALMAAVVAALAECDVQYPGADLPAQAIAMSARRAHSDVVGLSIIDGGAPRVAQRELAALRAGLPARARVVVGGAAAALIDDTVLSLGAERLATLEEWRQFLESRRRP